MLFFYEPKPYWRKRDLRDSYDVVIIGAGVHGLATAYYLAKNHGIKNVAVLDKGYLGGGNSGRNTAIIRSNYRTPEGIPFYDASVKLYEDLSKAVGFNVMFSQQGHLTLAHTDSTITGLRVRAEANTVMGVNSRIIGPAEIKKLVPAIDVSDHPRLPILAALYHPPGGIIRHDAVVWGYASAVDRMGVEIHPHTEVKGIMVNGSWSMVNERPTINHRGEVAGVVTNRGEIKTGMVVNCTAGWCSIIAKMVGLDLPIVSHPLQACVTEPLKPFLDKVIVSANLHVYVNQTDRGEVVLGAEIDPYQTYSLKATLPTLEMIADYTLQLFPCLRDVKVLRQWGGVCDMTPDFSPIIGFTPVKGFILDVGWGTYGFKAGPIAGKMTAELIATGRTPKLIEPFALSRFAEDCLVGEKAAAAVSH
jgi:sarcosine oxidase subunit beta